jgi:hypothetical protein
MACIIDIRTDIFMVLNYFLKTGLYGYISEIGFKEWFAGSDCHACHQVTGMCYLPK